MESTIHFFIPLDGVIPVPDGYSSTRLPSGFVDLNYDSPSLTSDGIHFIFHHTELDAPAHLGLAASMVSASTRLNNPISLFTRPDGFRKNFQTVVEVMVELEEAQVGCENDTSIKDTSPESSAFDRAIDELNVLLHAISFAKQFPMKKISRESIAPMVAIAFSNTKPWEMVSTDNLPEIEAGGVFNLNFNYPLTPFEPDSFGNLDDLISVSLAHLSSRGPFSTYLDFRREADVNYTGEGNYRAATIMYAAGCESLFEDLLQHNLWEQKIRPEEAKTEFVTNNGYPRSIHFLVNNKLGKFYSGDGWRENIPEPVAAWSKNVAQLRNRAVHDGYIPTAGEMRRCVASVDQLVTFLADQVFESRRERPMTALALLGQGGLEKRGGWNQKFSKLVGNKEDVLLRHRTFRRWADALSCIRSRDQISQPNLDDAICFLVIETTGRQSLFLVEEGGIRAQRISSSQLSFPPMVEQKIKELGHKQPPCTPFTLECPFNSANMEVDPAWDLYSYDVIPGHEIFLPLQVDTKIASSH
ncbi:hypothetical protein [Corynebacterium propinquum]